MKKRPLTEKEHIAIMQALRWTSIRNVIIEECAQVAEAAAITDSLEYRFCKTIAAAIRTLKDKP